MMRTRRGREVSPVDGMTTGSNPRCWTDTNKIEQLLVARHPFNGGDVLWRVCGDENQLSANYRLWSRLDHQACDVWNCRSDIVSVGTSEQREVDVRVKDFEFAALPKESLDENDKGALSEIISAFLEGATENANFLFSK